MGALQVSEQAGATVLDKRHAQLSPQEPANRFDRMEWAGAFGDVGTLIPFALGYISILKMDPFGVLFAFGISMVACGAYYKTPFPVQPMKAIGAVAITQAAQTATITPAAVLGATLATGVIWLVLGVTGTTARLSKLICRPVIEGLILGLGMGFMLEGVKMMATQWVIAAAGLFITILLLAHRKVPAMFLLLLFGAACSMVANPDSIRDLAAISIVVQSPEFLLLNLTWQDFLIGLLFLAIPQLPLTLGNAVIAIREENNRLFPDHLVTERGVATSTGIMNFAASAVGGVPMCHGAGGMAGQVAFGARTGGAPIIAGASLLILAVFFSNSVEALFRLFPTSVLGVVLFITGTQLALGSCEFGKKREERYVSIVTAAFALWNVGVAFLVGMALWHLAKRGWLKV